MQHIATVPVGSGGAASITFSAIPDTFTDLLIKVSARTDATGAVFRNIRVTFNGSGTGYSERLLSGDGSSVTSLTSSEPYLRFFYATSSTATANTFANGEMYVPNYRAAQNKSVSYDSVVENNATASLQVITAGLWSNTSAITSITMLADAGVFVENSTFGLYGITAGSDGIVAVS